MMVLWVGLGGAIGAVLRYLCVTAAARIMGQGFPYGTFAVNAVGSFAMGLAAVWLAERAGPRAAFLMPGILGGFTTFSAYSLDAVRLIEDGRIGAAATYIGGSVVIAILALYLGLILGRSL
ncbi:MAG: fluoride efflux transporter CrcB [Pseudomonadota bacterium]